MAYRVNREHFVFFRTVTGLTLSNFVSTFLVDTVPVTTCTLSLVELTSVAAGLYVCSYTPVDPGFYFLQLVNTANSVNVIDTVEIDTTDTFFGTDSLVLLTQDYGYPNRFKVPTTTPSTTKICIYKSTDWVSGNTSGSYLVSSTSVDSSGNWITTPISVNHGTYHIVQTIANKTTKVLAAFLVV
jgi:hypothetical protein